MGSHIDRSICIEFCGLRRVTVAREELIDLGRVTVSVEGFGFVMKLQFYILSWKQQ